MNNMIDKMLDFPVEMFLWAVPFALLIIVTIIVEKIREN